MEVLDDDHVDRHAREALKSILTGVIAGTMIAANDQYGVGVAAVVGGLYFPLSIVFYEVIEKLYGRPE